MVNSPPWRYRAIYWVLTDLRDWLFPYAGINLLWFFLSLTIVLFPPATVALYAVAYQSYHNQSPSLSIFWRGFRQWFFWSYLWGLAIFLIFVIFFASIAFYGNHGWFWGQVFTTILFVIFLSIQYYYLPYLILQEQPLPILALKNSILTLLSDPIQMIFHGILLLIFGIPSIVMIAPVIFIFPIFLALLSTYNLFTWLHQQGKLTENPRESKQI